MPEHLSLGRPIESTGYRWTCPGCGRDLRWERSPRTGWRKRWFAFPGKRHPARSCKPRAEQERGA